MKTNLIFTLFRGVSLLMLAAAAACLVSCSNNDGLEERLESRNDWYQDLQDRRTLRQEARQMRTDAWYDRAMH